MFVSEFLPFWQIYPTNAVVPSQRGHEISCCAIYSRMERGNAKPPGEHMPGDREVAKHRYETLFFAIDDTKIAVKPFAMFILYIKNSMIGKNLFAQNRRTLRDSSSGTESENHAAMTWIR